MISMSGSIPIVINKCWSCNNWYFCECGMEGQLWIGNGQMYGKSGSKSEKKKKDLIDKLRKTTEKNQGSKMKDPMICPECNGKMEKFSRVDGNIQRFYGKCKVCKYTCSADFVSGFWAGVSSVKDIEETNAPN